MFNQPLKFKRGRIKKKERRGGGWKGETQPKHVACFVFEYLIKYTDCLFISSLSLCSKYPSYCLILHAGPLTWGSIVQRI